MVSVDYLKECLEDEWSWYSKGSECEERTEASTEHCRSNLRESGAGTGYAQTKVLASLII